MIRKPMRDERQMMELILGYARQDERVRAVILNGSRANPDATRDIFQDYDIVYVVTDVEPFVRDRSWLAVFGERLIMQTPDDPALFPGDGIGPGYAYLMQFTDGNRIDLTLFPAGRLADLREDSLSVLLLDKDGRIGSFPPPSVRDYLPQPPTAKRFEACCNEFWWVSTYVAKGLRRGELPYAKAMMEGPVRHMLIRMLEWEVGLLSGWAADPGKNGKYLERHLPEAEWAAFVRTYPDGTYEAMWSALFAMGGLFRTVAEAVADRCGFTYNRQEDKNVTGYLRHLYTTT